MTSQYIFINDVRDNTNSSILYNDISDHFPVLVKIEIPVKYTRQQNVRETRTYTSENIQHFNNELSQIDWNTLLHESLTLQDAEKAYNAFLETYSSLYLKHFPIRQQKYLPAKFLVRIG